MLLMDRRKQLCYFRHTDWKILPQSHLATDVTHCTLRHNSMHKHYTSYPLFYSFTHSFLSISNQKDNVDCNVIFYFICGRDNKDYKYPGCDAVHSGRYLSPFQKNMRPLLSVSHLQDWGAKAIRNNAKIVDNCINSDIAFCILRQILE